MEPDWQKSSFSGSSGQGECVELSASATGRIHLRESDEPGRIVTPAPAALAALLGTLKRQH
ncbi:DUF397 domain-containing protein [Streptomyces sp. NBC_00237]|uniref:DUF397 domain-containing protein n=1 Tax=Streptomyces sp. NBC_00237 TaxID=2975687 RepID=UPI00224FF130|nr:DUF397 domain-containing protein [Streptomyces sp. NBC_00237]MCX5200549.1 DUF397 domain-containing protein [Streptomyces sp. NBC_00237]